MGANYAGVADFLMLWWYKGNSKTLFSENGNFFWPEFSPKKLYYNLVLNQIMENVEQEVHLPSFFLKHEGELPVVAE